MFDVMSKLGTHNYCDYTDDLLENIINCHNNRVIGCHH